LQIVLTGQPELRDVLNHQELRQLKQRIALRCVIKPLPNVEETEHYITSRLLVAGAERTDIFSPGAVDYIFRCSEGIPRQINNLCDNALLTGYAEAEPVIGRAIIEEVAETFDMLPRADRGRQMGEEREAPARIFTAAGRAELWAAGAGEGHAPRETAPENSTSSFEDSPSFITDAREEKGSEQSGTHEPDEVGAAFRQSGLSGEI
jgi:general secretion pathway protein A